MTMGPILKTKKKMLNASETSNMSDWIPDVCYNYSTVE